MEEILAGFKGENDLEVKKTIQEGLEGKIQAQRKKQDLQDALIHVLRVCSKFKFLSGSLPVAIVTKESASISGISAPSLGSKNGKGTPLEDFEDSMKELETPVSQETSREDKKLLVKKICRFYQRRQCKFFGKKSDQCKFLHPKKCQQFMEHGPRSNKNPKGCDVKSCKSFHPKICVNSLKNKECSVNNCQSSHLRGTKKTVGKNHDNFTNLGRGTLPQNDITKKTQSTEPESFLVQTILSRLDRMDRLFTVLENRGHLSQQTQVRQQQYPHPFPLVGGSQSFTQMSVQ